MAKADTAEHKREDDRAVIDINNDTFMSFGDGMADQLLCRASSVF